MPIDNLVQDDIIVLQGQTKQQAKQTRQSNRADNTHKSVSRTCE